MIRRIPAGRVVLTTRANGHSPPEPAEDIVARMNATAEREADLAAQIEACPDVPTFVAVLLTLPRDARIHHLDALAERIAQCPPPPSATRRSGRCARRCS